MLRRVLVLLCLLCGVSSAQSTLQVPHGGSGATTLTGLLYGNGGAAFTGIANGSNGTFLSLVSGAPVWTTLIGGGIKTYSNVSITGNTVANTTTETAFTSSYTITGGTTSAGDVLTIDLAGVYSTAVAPPNVTIKVKLGSTVVLASNAITSVGNISGLGWNAHASLSFFTVGSSGTCDAQAQGQFNTNATTGTSLAVNVANAGTTVINTTIDQIITVTITWSAANASNTITCNQFNVNWLRAQGTGTPVAVAQGGTGLTTLSTSATASQVAARDANANISANNWIGGYTTTATGAGTLNLTVGSAYVQFLTGTQTHTVKLPDVTTLSLGHQFVINNNSTGAVTVQSSGANNIVVLAANTQAVVTCILTSGTTAASWNSAYFAGIFTSGKSLSVSNSLTLAGTDATTQTFPTTSATIARTDAAQTFTGIQTFNTAVAVGSGGTGVATATTYAPLVGGTTSTGAFQSASTGQGTSGFVLTSTGSSAVPSFQAIPGVWTTTSVSGSDYTTTSAALTPVTGLAFAAAASTTYEIDAWLDCATSADANGMQFGINSSGTSPAVLFQVSGALTSTTVGVSGNNSNNTACASTYLTTASQVGFIHIWGIVKSGTGTPTITIRILKVTSGTATVRIGSKLNYRIQ